MKKTTNKPKSQLAYIIHMLFSLLGFIFILLFCIKGIFSLVYLIMNYKSVVGSLAGEAITSQTLIELFKYSPGPWFDAIMRIFTILIMLHAIVGGFRIMSTSFKMKPMIKGKKSFYLHILSSIAILIFVFFMMRRTGGNIVQIRMFWALNVLISVLGGYHLARGFYNACITLGISLSIRTRKVVMVLSWIVGGLSIMQIAASFM